MTPNLTEEQLAELVKLAERVEAATGPDRELDGDIHSAIGLPFNWFHPDDEAEPVRILGAVKPYTASLDAAMTLGHSADLWCVGRMEDGPFARVVPALPEGNYGDEITSYGAGEASALTAAFLRATAARALAQEEPH